MERLALAAHSLDQLLQAPQSSANVSLTTISGPLLPDAWVVALANMMAEVQARFHKQLLPPGTPDMYLREWEEMAAKFGLVEFRDALARCIRNRERPAFFPEPHEIDAECKAGREAVRLREAGKKHVDEIAEWKAIWLREREEEHLAKRVIGESV